jgi:hypothetical protein
MQDGTCRPRRSERDQCTGHWSGGSYPECSRKPRTGLPAEASLARALKNLAMIASREPPLTPPLSYTTIANGLSPSQPSA